MKKIKNVIAREILDSKGLPTIETEIQLDSGICGKTVMPSNFPTGKENIEIKDKDSRYFAEVIQSLLKKINTKVKKALVNNDVHNQKRIDQILTNIHTPEDELNINNSAILSLSISSMKASSNALKIPLFEKIRRIFDNDSKYFIPTPMINLINGGIHAGNTISFQEFMIIPAGARSFGESINYSIEIFHILKSLLKKHGHNTNIADGGGFSPNLRSNQEAIEYILLAVEKSSLNVGKDIFLGLDIAGNELYKKNKVFFFKKNYASIIETFMELTEKLVRDYPIISLEDPFCEKDFFSWKYLNNRIGKKIQLVGDDIFMTNEEKLKNGIDDNLANAVIIKLHHIETITEAINIIKLAKKNDIEYIISHRSGELEDSFVSDFAIGVQSKQIKFGPIGGGNNSLKYNRLLK